ncbi:RNA pyrophosphohydrolase [Chelonobacter oris]|nr:RNA pyrophosphohydrolase [Chelonobacter oris]MDH3000068.1 RNA pyrophosphohydrolase [Chelonobacter oris]
MIDFDGYRPNVGIIICNPQGQVLWAKRCGQNSWQFPQGGINQGETPEQAMYRELFEEVGLSRQDVKILAVSKGWLRYKLPKRLVRNDGNPVCIGQKQRWFLLMLVSDEKNINMQATQAPEFDGWRWVSYWYPVRQVIAFKREVYRRVMKEFSVIMVALPDSTSAVATKSKEISKGESERYSPSRGKKPFRPYRKQDKRAVQNNKGEKRR